VLEGEAVHISRDGRAFHNIREVWVFHGRRGDFWRMHFDNGTWTGYARLALTVMETCTDGPKAQSRLSYPKETAAVSSFKAGQGDALLEKLASPPPESPGAA